MTLEAFFSCVSRHTEHKVRMNSCYVRNVSTNLCRHICVCRHPLYEPEPEPCMHPLSATIFGLYTLFDLKSLLYKNLKMCGMHSKTETCKHYL